MKRLALLLGLAGTALLIYLVWKSGFSDLLAILQHAGWGLLILVPLHALPMLMDTCSWRVLLRQADHSPGSTFGFTFRVCAIREAFGMLPLTSIVGDIAGIRMMRTCIPDGAAVVASVVAEAFITLCNQYVYLLIGLCLIAGLIEPPLDAFKLSTWVALAVLLALPIPFALASILRSGKLFHRLQQFLSKAMGARLAAIIHGAALDEALRVQFSRPRRMLFAMSLQLLGYLLAALETWLALKLLGYPMSFAAAIALEAVVITIRQLLVIIPAGVGLQEAALLALGSVLGLPAEAALALSLSKRAREFLYSTPALLSWQWFEWSQTKQKSRADTPA